VIIRFVTGPSSDNSLNCDPVCKDDYPVTSYTLLLLINMETTLSEFSFASSIVCPILNPRTGQDNWSQPVWPQAFRYLFYLTGFQ